MGFAAPGTDNRALHSIDEALQSVAEDVEERRRSDRRWRVATLVVALLALGVSAGSFVVALLK
jgi:hypothetical protein